MTGFGRCADTHRALVVRLYTSLCFGMHQACFGRHHGRGHPKWLLDDYPPMHAAHAAAVLQLQVLTCTNASAAAVLPSCLPAIGEIPPSCMHRLPEHAHKLMLSLPDGSTRHICQGSRVAHPAAPLYLHTHHSSVHRTGCRHLLSTRTSTDSVAQLLPAVSCSDCADCTHSQSNCSQTV